MQRTPASPRRLEWLNEQLDLWRADGLVGDEQALAIRDRYEPNTRTALTSLVLVLGVVFVGVGLLWSVATNYDEISPAARFGIVALLWLGFTVGGTVTPDKVGGPLRLLAALVFGGVIFQAAQSLNVPAYEPSLLLAWAAGALAFAYGARSVGPLVVGVTTGVGWYLWTMLDDPESAVPIVLALTLATPVLAAVAVAHGRDRMGGPWLRAASATGLLGLLIAAFPGALGHLDELGRPVWAGLAVGLIAIVAAAARADRAGLAVLAGSAGVAGSALALTVTVPADGARFFASTLNGSALVHGLAASLVFLAAAVGVALMGVARQAPGLVNFAAASLVLFVTLQSFGLFAPLVSGAGLFLIVGALLVGTGLLVDRGRRRLREEISA